MIDVKWHRQLVTDRAERGIRIVPDTGSRNAALD
jgi:hypothetical protein